MKHLILMLNFNVLDTVNKIFGSCVLLLCTFAVNYEASTILVAAYNVGVTYSHTTYIQSLFLDDVIVNKYTGSFFNFVKRANF